MKKNHKVSVIMASYNHASWLSEAIESVLNQTFKDFEFIIVDDGSNDGSAEIIKKYAKKDNRIKYEIFPENKGAVQATKRCYDMTSSEYISLINSDDIWVLDKIEQQVSILDKNKNIGAVFGLATFIDESGSPIKVSINEFNSSSKINTRAEWMNFFFNNGNCICHPTILIRKKCYEKVGFYNPIFRSLPDFEMWVRMFWEYEIKVLNKVMIKFRKHSFNESSNNIGNNIRVKTESKQILKHFVSQIKTVNELIEIFPEYLDIFKINNNLLVPFYIAQIALTRKIPYFSDFAFDILYTEMAKNSVLKVIEQNNLYSIKQLHKDLVLADIYNTKKTEIKTYIKVPFLIRFEKYQERYTTTTFIFEILKIKFFKKIKSPIDKSIYFLGIKIR